MADARIEQYVARVLSVFKDREAAELAERIIRKNYNKGIEHVEKQLKLQMNVVPNKHTIDFLKDYAFDLVKGMKKDMADKLRGELSRALLNGEGASDIKERVMRVMDVSEARAASIARTESHRAYNMGAYNAAVDSGLTLKKVVFNPSPQSKICKTLTKRSPIDLEDKWDYKGDEYQGPPFHVNCRSRVLYEQVEDES